MAKNMARLDNGKVINIEWLSDGTEETADRVNCGDVPVDIGDDYRDGTFYRAGVKVLTPMEAMVARLTAAENELSKLGGGESNGIY